MKRGIALPKGCKDLSDVLRRGADESPGKPGWPNIRRRFLVELTKQLKAPGLSAVDRATIERFLQALKEQMRKAK
jgi:hypothetical protein